MVKLNQSSDWSADKPCSLIGQTEWAHTATSNHGEIQWKQAQIAKSFANSFKKV